MKGIYMYCKNCFKTVTLLSSSSAKVDQRRDYIDQSDVVVESHDRVSSLESHAVTPKDILAQGPLHIIRYVLHVFSGLHG